MEDNNVEESEQKLEPEVAPALIAVHPAQQSVAVAVGSDLRIFNLQDGSGVESVDENGGHKGPIRCIRYSKSGNIFVSAGDDKLVKIWDAKSWRCIHSVASEKRVSAVAISNNEKFVCFADKFGVVYVVNVNYDCESPAPVSKKAVPILSHYCSIITRLEFSPDGQYIISADRDFKIRVTVFPKNPLHGAHEIQCFCLGHTEYVSCLAFASSEGSDGFLLSGSGDATVRLWDYTTGSLLDTCDVGAKVSEAGFLSSNRKEEEAVLPTVTDLCPTSNGSLIAVAIQSLPGIMLLNCNLSSKTLSVAKVVHVTGEAFIPTSIGAAFSTQLLWMVMGASSLQTHESVSLARVRVLSGFNPDNLQANELEPSVLEDSKIPGGEPLLQALQGKLSIGKEAFSTAAEAVKTAMRNLLIKKQYSAERREFRKRGRNDKKN